MADSSLQTAAEKDEGMFIKFYQDGDMDSIAQLYTENCRLMAPGTDVKLGRKAVAQLMRTVKAKGVARVDVKTEEVSLVGEYGYRMGKYSIVMEDGTIHDTGSSMMVLKKEDGVYKIHSDVFSSDDKHTSTLFRET
ncbi:uncharacterized protein [Ptychodera flava]|uniref:uncharacterized protein isoform X1 n=1 Tax=Ptychodera flava TaxID=63121 RepID=UPI00396A6C2D